MSDVVRTIDDGSRIALGGFPLYQCPMALVHELIRQHRRGLTIVGGVNGIEADMLIGAGCVAAIETSYVGLEQFGLARNYKRAVELDRIKVADVSEEIAFDRFRANQEGWSFLPSFHLAGTSIPIGNPLMTEATCPITGRPFIAVRPADPDVVVIHAAASDEWGNIIVPRRTLLPQSIDLQMARACDRVVVTVEHLVSTEFVRRHPELGAMPGFQVEAVVVAPWGAHPTSMLGFYDLDDVHIREYAAASARPDGLAEYLQKYVEAAESHADYLDRIGLMQVLRTRRWASI